MLPCALSGSVSLALQFFFLLIAAVLPLSLPNVRVKKKVHALGQVDELAEAPWVLPDFSPERDVFNRPRLRCVRVVKGAGQMLKQTRRGASILGLCPPNSAAVGPSGSESPQRKRRPHRDVW